MDEKQRNDIMEIDIIELIGYLLKRWYLFLLFTLLLGGAGFGISEFLLVPQYESTTKIIILNRQDGATITYSDLQLSSQLTKDYEELISSRDVLETVITTCGLKDDYEDLLERITIENVTDTRIISITVEDPSPAQAQHIANEIRETAAAHIQAVTDVEAVNVAETANLPAEPSSPSVLLWVIAFAAIGFILIAGILITRFLLDDTIKTADDIEKYLGLPTLAVVPLVSGKPKKEK